MLFFLGLTIGAAAGWFFWWSMRREAVRLDEEKQLLAQEKRIVLDFMHGMVEAIGDGLDRQGLFQRVVHAAILGTGALSACVFEREGRKLRGVAVEGLFPPHRPLPPALRDKASSRARFLELVLRSEIFDVGEGLAGAAAETGEGILVVDALRDPRIIKHDDPALHVRSVIVAPISFRQHNLGVLAIVNPADGGSFGESDFSLAQSLAEQTGLAAHNLDLMAVQIEKNRLDVDLSLAREIQDMLLPKQFPDNDALDIAAVYRPAQKVGGDLYNIFELGPERVGVAIADVSGKGVPASLVMAICQSNLRHFARQFESPKEVLLRLNEVLVNEMRQDMFVTVVYAVIDLRAESLVLCRAGHEQPLVLAGKSEGGAPQVDLIKSEGMALGLVSNDIFDKATEDLERPFRPGDVLLLYTDGVTESTNDQGTEYSNARLADTLERLSERSAEAINADILERVGVFSGHAPHADDITLVTVRRVR